MAAAEKRPDWMVAVDEAILEELRERRLDYVSLIASRRGIHLKYAERRFRTLERRGFVERTSAEVTYRITAKGERYLEDESPTP